MHTLNRVTNMIEHRAPPSTVLGMRIQHVKNPVLVLKFQLSYQIENKSIAESMVTGVQSVRSMEGCLGQPMNNTGKG